MIAHLKPPVIDLEALNMNELPKKEEFNKYEHLSDSQLINNWYHYKKCKCERCEDRAKRIQLALEYRDGVKY